MLPGNGRRGRPAEALCLRLRFRKRKTRGCQRRSTRLRLWGSLQEPSRVFLGPRLPGDGARVQQRVASHASSVDGAGGRPCAVASERGASWRFAASPDRCLSDRLPQKRSDAEPRVPWKLTGTRQVVVLILILVLVLLAGEPWRAEGSRNVLKQTNTGNEDRHAYTIRT